MRYTHVHVHVLTNSDHRHVKSNNVHMILHVYIQHNSSVKKQLSKRF